MIHINDEFPQIVDLRYLNHAAVSPWPARTARAVKQFSDENVKSGATKYQNWLELETKLRSQIKKLINVVVKIKKHVNVISLLLVLVLV